MNILIIGAGPRGLAIALQASLQQIPCTIIDPQPYFNWTNPNIIPNIVMRSPLTFDLTTYIEELQQYSLSNFLGIDYKFSINQKEIESNSINPTREQFIQYLQYIYSLLKHDSNINLVKDKVILIGKDFVKTNSNIFYSNNIVIAAGTCFSKQKIPYWVDESKLKTKVVRLQDVISNNYKDKNFAVIGSGQGAAEITCYLAKNNKVNWLINKPLKVSQYPSPAYKDWNNKSALGEYYKNILKQEVKHKYLKDIKSWQPSITPYISGELDKHKNNINILMPKSTSDLDSIFESIDCIVISTGFEINVLDLPFEDSLNIELNEINSNYPKLIKGFKSSSHSSLYFTGALATMYDGPRQNSLISSAITAREILENIENGR